MKVKGEVEPEADEEEEREEEAAMVLVEGGRRVDIIVFLI